jgi:hypothetical protein
MAAGTAPNTAALSRIVMADRHLMALKSIVRVAHSRWQQRAACSSLQSVPFRTDSWKGTQVTGRQCKGDLSVVPAHTLQNFSSHFPVLHVKPEPR